MGASHASASQSMSSRRGRGQEDSDSSDDEKVDRLATATKTGVLLEVMTPRIGCPWHADQSKAGPSARFKNVLGEDWSAPKVTPRTVLLHVYDLEEFKGANNVLTFSVDSVAVGGAFHAGVEVFGNEWSYGIRGVKCEVPRCAEGHSYRCTVPLGDTQLSAQDVAGVLFEMCQTWRGRDYELFSRNCCSFAAEFCRRLGKDDFPPWVDRFARTITIGQQVGQAAGEGIMHVGKEVGAMLKEAGYAASELVGDSSWLKSAAAGWLKEVEQPPQRRDDAGVTSLQLPGQDSAILVEDGRISLSTQHQVPAVPAFPASEPVFVSRVLETGPDDASTARVVSQRQRMEQIAEDAEQRFPPGAIVEYESSSHVRWIPAKVLSRCPASGLYDLDCKGQVPGDRIRWPGAAGAALLGLQLPRSAPIDLARPHGQPGFPRTATMDLGAGQPCPPRTFTIDGGSADPIPSGADVEYFSNSHGRWVPAKVLVHFPTTGFYDLDCKVQVPRHRIRLPGADLAPDCRGPHAAGYPPCPPRAAAEPESSSSGSSGASSAAGGARYAVDAQVEYCSASHGRWIQATVLAYHAASGLYDLDVKSQAPPERVRPRGAQDAPAGGVRTPVQTGVLGAVATGVLGAAAVSRETSWDLCGAAGQTYPVGAVVEYKSASHDRWVAAKVCAFHAPSGLYDLDCKSQVEPDRLRWPQPAPAAHAAASSASALAHAAAAAAAPGAAPGAPAPAASVVATAVPMPTAVAKAAPAAVVVAAARSAAATAATTAPGATQVVAKGAPAVATVVAREPFTVAAAVAKPSAAAPAPVVFAAPAARVAAPVVFAAQAPARTTTQAPPRVAAAAAGQPGTAATAKSLVTLFTRPDEKSPPADAGAKGASAPGTGRQVALGA